MKFIVLTSLGMSEVDTVQAWGGRTSTPPESNYFSEFSSQSHVKLTNNKPNKDFKSVNRPQVVEKFKVERKIFSSWKIEKQVQCDIRTHNLAPITLNRIHWTTGAYKNLNTDY